MDPGLKAVFNRLIYLTSDSTEISFLAHKITYSGDLKQYKF